MVRERSRTQSGPVAEWLGSALQKLLQRFESARDLKIQTQSFDNQVIAFFVSSFCRVKCSLAKNLLQILNNKFLIY